MPNARSAQGTRVIIAGVSTRAMAESAARAGFEVTAIDAFGDLDHHPDVRAVSLPRDFGVAYSAAAAARVARDFQADAVAYLSNFENRSRAVRALSDGRALWGNGSPVLERVRDPELLAQVFDDAGVAAAECVTADRAHVNVEWLLKPRASGGGLGVHRWRPRDAVPHDSYVQRFVDGVPGSIACVAANDGVVPLCLTRQLIGDAKFGASQFRYCGSILSCVDDAQFAAGRDLLSAATSLATVAAREFNLVGVNGIDFIANDGVPVAIEVNPRYSASMELAERAFGVSVFGAHAAACATGELPSFDLERAAGGVAAVGKAIVFARHDVVCGDTHAWLHDQSVRDVPHPAEQISAGRPVCTVFGQGNGSHECYAALVRRAEAVYAVLDGWRRVSS